MPKMLIYISEEELQELLDGEKFNWNFPTDDGQRIDVCILKGDEDDINNN